MYVSKAN